MMYDYQNIGYHAPASPMYTGGYLHLLRPILNL